jgi:HAMP domain-containing protein
MKKPGTDQVVNKLSYSRLYAPLGWIISTGFYTDQIEAQAVQKEAQLNTQIRNIIMIIAGIAGLILIVGLGLAYYFSQQLTETILTLRNALRQLAAGEHTEEVKNKRKDEVGDITESLNMLVRGLRRYTAFAKKIGEGDLSQHFDPLSTKDILGNELLDMRGKLQKTAHEKAIRDWSTEGLALVVDVLRKNTTDTEALAHALVKQLVNYMGVNQGALFLKREDASGDYLELIAAYAYTRRKFLSKRVNFGEGLVGQCVLERRTVHMTQVPKDYMTITSGLGDAPPQTVLIVPLIHNDVVYGVVEMAAFKMLKAHEIAFVEKVAESIASTISTVEVNERTKRLLEQSQQMSEDLKAQEEELRQNQEELQATQEQMRRRQLELEKENERLKEERRSAVV